MDFFFVEYRDPILGLVILVALIFIIALINYLWQIFSHKNEQKGLDKFIKNYEIQDDYKDLLKLGDLHFDGLIFLASTFTKSGEFEKATQIYLLALEKNKDKNKQEFILTALAEVYFKAGFLQKSKELLYKALKIKARNAKALKLLKIVCLKLQNYEEMQDVLESLFELGFDTKKEHEFIKALILHKDKDKNKQEKLNLSLKLAENNVFMQRFLFEKYKLKVPSPLEYLIDLLYHSKDIFVEDEEYKEFFIACGKLDEKAQWKNTQFKMLKILKDNDFKARLAFSYFCMECKNTLPLFFYHCPLCYEFGSCKILYEVKVGERY